MQERHANADRLPRHCSPDTAARDCDVVDFTSGVVSIGRFRCDVRHPSFGNTGPIRDAVVVFPRTSVWIRHEGGRPFVADPNVVTIYNRGQRYERRPISPTGDHCDWFAVSDAAAREIIAGIAPERAEAPERPFAFERASAPAALYARQRALLRRTLAGHASALEVEEESLAIVDAVLRLAHAARPAGSSATASPRRRDLAEATRAELARTALENRSVAELARTLGASPFHLCRVFREQTGQTMHRYRVGLRVRAAIERLEAPVRGARASLSTVAHAAGFASHAHFVRICHRELGLTPARLRAQLG